MKEDKVKLNTFGSAWVRSNSPERCRWANTAMQFWDEGRKNGIGSDVVPAGGIQVAGVQSEREHAGGKWTQEGVPQRRQCRDRDSGGLLFLAGRPANANVEVLVYQNPFLPDVAQVARVSWSL